MNTYDAIQQNPKLTDEQKEQFCGALATRGKYKGYLLANAPNSRTRPGDWLAWQVLVSNIAPARVSIFGLMFNATDDYSALDKIATDAGLPFALNTCEPAMRWNLWAMNHDREIGQKGLLKVYDEWQKEANNTP